VKAILLRICLLRCKSLKLKTKCGYIIYTEVLRSIEGIGLFPSISLIIFLALFAFVVIYVTRKGKPHWDNAASIPLDDTKVFSKSATNEV
jgi:hypothetical protein